MKESTRARIRAERQRALGAYIQEQVEKAPPLTPEQRDKLWVLLHRPSSPEEIDDGIGHGGALDEMMGED